MHTIHFDLRTPFKEHEAGVIRAYSGVCFALNIQMLDHDQINLYPYKQHKPGVLPLQLMPDQLSLEDSMIYREVFVQWVIGNALRDLVDGFAVYLDATYTVLELASRINNGLVQYSTALESELAQKNKVFEKLGITDKLSFLEKTFNFSSTYSDGLDTLKVARNCLTHRGGVVGRGVKGQQDLNDGDYLTVKWHYLRAIVVLADGKEEDWVEGELYDNAKLECRPEECTKSILKGDRLTLDPNEVGQICLNFINAANDFNNYTISYLQSRGIVVTNPDLPDNPSQ